MLSAKELQTFKVKYFKKYDNLKGILKGVFMRKKQKFHVFNNTH